MSVPQARKATTGILSTHTYVSVPQARKATKKFGVSDWCRKFVVEFQGEEGEQFKQYQTENVISGDISYMHSLKVSCVLALLVLKCIFSTVFVGNVDTITTCILGLDWGGVSREFFHVLSVECFDVSNNMFTSFNKENMQALVSTY